MLTGLLWAGGVAALIYGGALGALFVFQRSLLYYPGPVGPGPEAVGLDGVADVRVETADGLELRAWWRAPPHGAPTLLYLHGNAGTLAGRADKVRPYLDAGYGLLLLAWRGYDGNPGRPTEQGLYRDAAGALAFLAERGIAADRLVLYGESLGGGVAVRMAAEAMPAALVLETPFDSIPAVAQAHYPFFPVKRLVRDRFDSAAWIGRVAAPVLILHGEHDRTVPIRFAERLYARAGEPKRFVRFPGAGHADLYDHGAARAVRAFLDEHGLSP
jgi:uncharacterized protein